MAELLYKTESPLSGRAKERSLEKCSSGKHVYFYVRVQGVGFRWAGGADGKGPASDRMGEDNV